MRAALIVARFELLESLRSRRVVIFLVLYLAASIGAAVFFAELLSRIEGELADVLGVARTSQPGAMTRAIMESAQVRRVVRSLVGDGELADVLLDQPPMPLLYHWVALSFGPPFVMLTSSDAISSELASGSVRYALARTDRTSWAVGKLIAHFGLASLGVAAGAIGAWAAGALLLQSFELLDNAAYLSRYAFTAAIFVFPYVGLSLGVSQVTRSVPWSRALGLLTLAAVTVAPLVLAGRGAREAAPVLADSLATVFPLTQRLELWRPDAATVSASALVLVALGILYFSLGHLRFARRDA